jgi:ribosomal protein L37AE/L43A
MAATESHACPDCGNQLRVLEGDAFECQRCDGTIPGKVVRNADELQELAESDLSGAWIADALLGVS